MVPLQFNTRLSQRHRAMLTELVDQHPYGRLATMRLVVEEAIDGYSHLAVVPWLVKRC